MPFSKRTHLKHSRFAYSGIEPTNRFSLRVLKAHLLELSDALGGGGDEHWGFLHFITRADGYVHDSESEPNDTLLDAQPLSLEEFENSGGNLFQRGQANGALDVVLDEDLYSFTVGYDEGWICACVNSAEFGSAIAPSLEILDADGEILISAAGDPAQDPDTLIENHPLEPGDYFLRVSGDEGSEGGPGSWYRFNLFSASFEVSSYAEGGFACPND